MTVRDILRLGSLQTGRLLAGQGGLSRPISGATILELTEMGKDRGEELLAFSLKAQEIMITALYNVRNDIDAQCDVIRTLSRLKASGLIVFYYGGIVRKFDSRVLELCNELDFPLIVLDYDDRGKIAYADVLNDIYSFVRSESDSLFHAIISSMLQIQQNGGGVQEALALIAQRSQFDIIIVDIISRRVLSTTLSEKQQEKFLRGEMLQIPFGMPRFELLVGDTKYYGQRYYTDYLELSILLIAKKPNGGMSADAAFSCTKYCVDFWRRNLVLTRGDSLINTIVQKKWQQAYIDLGYYRQTDAMPWHFLMYDMRNPPSTLISEVKALLHGEGITYVAGRYEHHELILFNRPAEKDAGPLDTLVQAALSVDGGQFIYATNLNDENELFQMLHSAVENWPFICALFQKRQRIGRFELIEAASCKRDCQNEENMKAARQMLLPLIDYDKRRGGQLLDTLQVFLIDTDCSYRQTSELTYTHQNTVQYRIRKTAALLGISFGQPAALSAVYHAVCIFRQMQQNAEPCT